MLCFAFMVVAISLPAEEQVKEEPVAPLVAADFECWEQGMLQVAGGWTTKEDRSGFTWFFTVSEIIEAGDGKMRGRFRRVEELDLVTYQRLQRMDDATFLKTFEKLHEERGGINYGYWKEARDGAVLYRDNERGDVGYHEFDIELPKDLTTGKEYRAFDRAFRVAALEKAMKGFWGECEAVRIDAVIEGKEIEGEEYPPHRVEQWYGQGLSVLHEQVLELANADDAKGCLMQESRLQRVIRPEAEAPQK